MKIQDCPETPGKICPRPRPLLHRIGTSIFELFVSISAFLAIAIFWHILILLNHIYGSMSRQNQILEDIRDSHHLELESKRRYGR